MVVVDGATTGSNVPMQTALLRTVAWMGRTLTTAMPLPSTKRPAAASKHRAAQALCLLLVVLLFGLSQFRLPGGLVAAPQSSSFFRRSSGGSIEVNSRNSTAAICAVAKFEEAYLQEWIDYHLGLGFAAIAIYDNSPDFELRQFEQPRVDLVHDPRPGLQASAYLDCAKRMAQQRHEWIAFFDVDEYLRLYEFESVVPFLRHFCPSGSLAINWKIVSHETPDGADVQLAGRPEPVTRRCVRPRMDVHDHVKSIAKVSDLDFSREPHAHYPHLVRGTHHDTNFRHAQNHRNGAKPSDVALLYHYQSKSQSEYIARRMRGRSDNLKGVPDKLDQFLVNDAKMRRQPTNETVFDDSVWQTLKRLQPKYALFDSDLTSSSSYNEGGRGARPAAGSPSRVGAPRVALCARDWGSGGGSAAPAASYLDEFADYHLALGFAHVYVWDVSDKFDLRALEQWARQRPNRRGGRRDVSVQTAPGSGGGDEAAFRRECASAATADGHDWVAFWDINEFLVVRGESNRTATLGDWLEGGRDGGGDAACVPKVLFGTGGVAVYEPLPVLKRFQLRHDGGYDGAAAYLHRLRRTSESSNATAKAGVAASAPPEFGPTKVPCVAAADDGTTATARLHVYTLSAKECWQSLVSSRGNVTLGINDPCSVLGTVPDSTAWDALKRMLPRYAGFDQFSKNEKSAR